MGIEPVIQRVQHRSGHRYAVMRFEQCRDVRRHHRDGVTGGDAAPAQRIGKAAAALIEFAIGEVPRPVDDGEFVGVGRGSARQKTERRQRREIGGIARQMRRIVDRFRRRQTLLRSLKAAVAGILPLPGISVKQEPAPCPHAELSPAPALRRGAGGVSGPGSSAGASLAARFNA